MTTNTKAITECSSCCWIIYCKYLFYFLFDLNVWGVSESLVTVWMLNALVLSPKHLIRAYEPRKPFSKPSMPEMFISSLGINPLQASGSYRVPQDSREYLGRVREGKKENVYNFLGWLIDGLRRRTRKTFSLGGCENETENSCVWLSAIERVFLLAVVNTIGECDWGIFLKDETDFDSLFCSEKPRPDNHKELCVNDASQQSSLRVAAPRRLERQNQRRNDDDQRLSVFQKRAGHRHASDSWSTPATSAARAHRRHLKENLQGTHGSGTRVL